MNVRFFIAAAFAGGRFFLASPCASANGSGLTSTSPFLPAAASSKSGDDLAAWSLELRGIVTGPEGPLFSIHDLTTKKAVWVGLNEGGREFVVRKYQVVAGRDQILVESHGLMRTLEFRRATISAVSAKGGADAAANADSALDRFGIPLRELTAAEEGRLEILAAQVRTRIARQKLTGTPAAGLLPDEEERFKLLVAQVRARVSQEKLARVPAPMAARQ